VESPWKSRFSGEATLALVGHAHGN
jgi:hypothetical protein